MPSLSRRTTTVSITVTAVVCAIVATYEFRRRRRRCRKRKSIECKDGSAFGVSSLKGELVDNNNEESTASTTAATARSIGKGSRHDEKDKSRSVSRSSSTSKENNNVVSSLSTSSLSCKSRGAIRIGLEGELKDSQMMMNVMQKKKTKDNDDEEERDGRRILNQPDDKLVLELEIKTSSSGGKAEKKNQEEEEKGGGGVDSSAVTKESVVEDNSTEEQHKIRGSDDGIRPAGVFNSNHKEKASEVDSSECAHGESHTAQETKSFLTSSRQDDDHDDYKVHQLHDRENLVEKEQEQQQTKDNQELRMNHKADASSSSSSSPSPFLQTRNSLRSTPSSPEYHTLHKRNKPITLATTTPTNNNKDNDGNVLPPPKDVGNYHILKSYWSNAASKNTPRGVLPLDDQRRSMNRSRSSSTRKFFVFSDKPIPKKNIKTSSSSSSLQQDQSMEQDNNNNNSDNDDDNDDNGKPMPKQDKDENGGVDNDDDRPTTGLDMKKAERDEKEKAERDDTLQGEKKERKEEVGGETPTKQERQEQEESEETLNDNKGRFEEKESAAVVVTREDEENEVMTQKREKEDAREEKLDKDGGGGGGKLTKAGDVDDDEMVEKQSGMNDKLDNVASTANNAASTETVITVKSKEASSKPEFTPSGKSDGGVHLLSYNQEVNMAPKPAGKEARARDEDGSKNLLETTSTDIVDELQVSDETEIEKNDQENCIGNEGTFKNIPAAKKENEQVKETAHDAGEVVGTDDTKKEVETTERAIHPDAPVTRDSTVSTADVDEAPPGNMGSVPTNSDDVMRDFISDTVGADMSTEKSTIKDESANISRQRQDQIHTMENNDQTQESLQNVAEKEMSNESWDFGNDEIPHTNEDAHTKLDALTLEGGNVLQRVGSAKPLKERQLDSSLQTEKDYSVLQRVGSAKPLKERQRELEPSTQTEDKNVGGAKEGEVSDDLSDNGNATETAGGLATDLKQ